RLRGRAPRSSRGICLTPIATLGSLLPMAPSGDYRDRIILDPQIRFDKPVIRGTRITVGDVLGYLAGGMSEAALLAEFPQLRHEDIVACLGFAADRERRVASIPGV
ncbi:MAG TPA: DUF433 domain-containing protein, partial [Gemmatimonadaceae bacterium]|nr:DUF433 domain-containing protein [Gemmatimonadaceae bacterium]